MVDSDSSFNTSPDLNKFTVPTTFTKPNVKFHWIEDGHLEAILNTNPTWPQIICGTSFGYLLGELRNVCSLFENVEKQVYSMNDMIFFGLFLVVSVIFICSGIKCWLSMSNAKKALLEIRSRKAMPL